MKRADILKAGAQLVDERRFAEAEKLYISAIKAAPRDVKLYSPLASLWTRHMNKVKDSEKIILRALQMAPKDPDLLRDAAEVCYYFSRMRDAQRYIRDSIAQGGKNNPDTLYVAATIFEKLTEYEEAADYLAKGLKLRPDHLPSKLLYADSIRSLGKLEESAEICREMLTDHPNSLQILAIYSQTTKLAADDPHIANLRDVVIPSLRDQGAPMKLSTALKCLGKANLDAGNHTEAFKNFKEAKELADIPHDRGKQRRYVAALKSSISVADYFGRVNTSDEERPLLIVGMPRVGSTLLEQVIASHPVTAGVGESGAMRSLLALAGISDLDGPSMVRAIKNVSESALAAMREQYLFMTVARHPNAMRVVDKNLHNFELLGLFARMFPKARIIHARRDPMDNCVACYLQRLSKWHSYTNDMSSLGQYYKEHLELMEHWKKVLPNPIMEVPYEAMVADTEGMARNVIDFLGLEWDDRVLEFQKTENRAKTASVWQVRQPIYKSSVKRWKKYEEFLDPLKEQLAPLYPNGFDD